MSQRSLARARPLTEEERQAAEELFRKHRNLPAFVCHMLAGCSSLPFEELLEEAEWRLATMLLDDWRRYDPARGQESTWITNMLRWHMLSFIRKHGKRPQSVELTAAASKPTSPKGRNRIRQMIADLSDEAAEVVWLILVAPAEIAEEIRPRNIRRLRQALQQYLRDQCGWTIPQINQAFREVQHAI